MSNKSWLIVGGAALALVAAVVAWCVVMTMKNGGGSLFARDVGVTVVLPGDVKLELVKVYAGTFTMGGPSSQKRRFDDQKGHKFTVPEDFYIGKTEVTQAQYKAVMGCDPAYFKGDDLPVEQVSWDDAMEFCKKLNEMGKAPSGWQFTLPTEAQWEYAARGGNRSNDHKYSGGENLSEVAWYYNNAGATRPVATKNANELGLYDMCGNVSEWCLDRYETAHVSAQESLEGGGVSLRGYRGSSFEASDGSCRLAESYGILASNRRDNFLGFRVALFKLKRGR